LLLRDPYQGLDPQVRQFWLDHVSEMQNIFEFYKSEGINAFAFVAPLVLSCLSLGVLAYRLPRQHQRNVLIILVALVLIGIGTEVVMIRVFSFTTIISVFGTLALSRLINIAPVLPQLHSAPRRLWAGLAALIITSPMLWVLVMGIVGRDDAAAQSEAKAGQACYERSSYSFLAHLPRGRILNYHEIGSHILLYTHHDIESAPYHRANHGNRLAFDVFASAPMR
jgi:hypothetical protein